MRNLIYILFVFASCNSSSEKASPVAVSNKPLTDSISLIVDSLQEWTDDLSNVSDYAIKAQSKINQLQKENRELAQRAGESEPLAFKFNEYPDNRDKQISDLITELSALKKENVRLRKRIEADSLIKYGKIKSMPDYIDQVPNELKPNDKSLIVTLNKKLRGDGDISEQGVSVWIMKYTKDAKKAFKGYESCQQKDLNLLNAKEANYYRGQYFFNDVEPGKYLIKVCALFGNWMVINKKDYKQEIEILMSPPIQ